MIRSFDKETEVIWNGERSRKLPRDIQDRALASQDAQSGENSRRLAQPAEQPPSRAEG